MIEISEVVARFSESVVGTSEDVGTAWTSFVEFEFGEQGRWACESYTHIPEEFMDLAQQYLVLYYQWATQCGVCEWNIGTDDGGYSEVIGCHVCNECWDEETHGE